MSHSSSRHDWVGEQDRSSRATPGAGRPAPAAKILGQASLIAAVVLGSWTFGGWHARVEVWLFTAAGLALLAWLVRQSADRGWTPRMPLAIVPLFLALALGAAQLIPLSNTWLTKLSPTAARCRAMLLPMGQPQDDRALVDAQLGRDLQVPPVGEAQPLTLYPASTRHDLALLALAVAVFMSGAVFFRRPRAQLLLCLAVAINGAALTLFEIGQRLQATGEGNWRHAWWGSHDFFGPFINPNNAGGFLNLSLAGALGLAVWALRREGGLIGLDAAAQVPPVRSGRHWLEVVGQLDAWLIASLALSAALVAGVLCTTSRGAAMSMIGGLAITSLVLVAAKGSRFRLGWLGLILALAVGVLGWSGMVRTVASRLSTMADLGQTLAPRLNHWRDGLKAAGSFWLTGSGLGTYRFVYPPFQQRPDRLWYFHAENQYLEAWAEAGVAGVALVVLLIVLVSWACWRVLRRAEDNRTIAFALATLFALSSQTIHAFFDFGLYMPANMLLLALFCGAVTAAAGDVRRRGTTPATPTRSVVGLRLVSAGLAMGLLALIAWGGMELGSQARAESAAESAPARLPPDNADADTVAATVGDLREAIADLQKALAQRPDDAEAHFRLACLYIDLYRLQDWNQMRTQKLPLSDEERWEGTRPAYLHIQAHQLCENGRYADLLKLRKLPLVQECLVPALREALWARNACPLLAEVHLAIAQLCVLDTAPLNDETHLERARQVKPGDSEVFYWCGMAEFYAGRFDRVGGDWRKALTMGSPRLADILTLADRRWPADKIIHDILPDSPRLLVDAARKHYTAPAQAGVRRLLAQRLEELLARIELPAAEHCYYRAVAAELAQRYPEAIGQYTQALEQRAWAIAWRFELAQLLARRGLLERAHEQARLCANKEPSNEKYQAFLEQIVHTSLTVQSDSARRLERAAPP